MSYPEFMQRRSTKPEKTIIEDVDYTFGSTGGALPAARTQGPMDAVADDNASEEYQQQQQQNENERGASATATNRTLRCVKDIWQAAIEGDVECLEANISLGASLSQLGQPILSSSSSSSSSGQQQPLWGPLFDRCALFRATPLQFACAYNRIEAAKFLLDQGASWEQLSSTGVSAKDYARRRNYLEILKLIEEKEHERRQKQQQDQQQQQE